MAYELATSVNLNYGKQPFLEGVEKIINAGFTNLDYNFLDMTSPNDRLWQDDYKRWIYECREFAEKRGAKWVQAHAVCTGAVELSRDEYINKIKRSVECCAYLGVEWTVCHTLWHPMYFFNDPTPATEFNRRMFSEILETAEKYNVGLAVENSTSFPLFEDHGVNTSTEQLIEFVDSFKSDHIGICWDIGHANINAVFEGYEHVAERQSEEFKKIGNRLKATHVHDNKAKTAGLKAGIKLNGTGINQTTAFDSHIQPFMGDIDWADIISGLDAIGYSHFFTYETHASTQPLPDELIDAEMRHLYTVGQYLVGQSKLK